MEAGRNLSRCRPAIAGDMLEPDPNPSQILVVEDDREIAELICAYLERAGYATDQAGSVNDALRLHAQRRPDLVVLDIGLRGGDGFDVLAAIRRRHDTPIIMVTALGDDVTKLSSLRSGADDFVVKPFNPSEVVERVRAVLRRARGTHRTRSISVGDLFIDLDARIVQCRKPGEGEALRLALTPTEFELLHHLAHQPGRAFSRSELLDAAAPDSEAYDRVIDSHVSKLRAKLTETGCSVRIEPVRGVGYRLWTG